MNAKGDLIARLLASGRAAPVFAAESTGPAHERTFHVTVTVDGELLGEGSGRSKKDAERAAAEAALGALDGSSALDGGTDGSSAEELAAEDAAGTVSPGQAGGVWPIYSGVLEAALEAAVEFAAEDDTLDDVRREAAQLYRGLLADLGHGPEDA